jgi:Flp pilus assembly protein TadD
VLAVEAELFKRAGYPDREMTALRQWAKLASRDHQPWLKLFYLYLDLGWRREAGRAAEAAVKRAPRDPRVLVARAIFFYRSREPALGLPIVAAALRLDPENPSIRHLQASMLLKAARYREAETKLRRTLSQHPHDIESRVALGRALLGQERAAEADAQWRAVQEQQPENVEAAYERGVLAAREGRLEEATRQLARAAARDAQYSNVLWHLGRLYVRQGRREEGRSLLATFRTMDARTSAFETTLARLEARPDDPALHARLARFRQEAGEWPYAIVEWRRVLELRPNDRAARRELAAALRRQGRLTESRAAGQGRP